MKTTQVKSLGSGQGAGDIVTVLDRQEIEKIIDSLDLTEVFRIAYSAWIPGCKSGHCELNLQTGKLEACGLSTGESNQACDDRTITLFSIGQNDELNQDGACGCEPENCICDFLHLDQDGDPYNIEDFFPLEWRYNVVSQLEEWYSYEN